MTHAARGSGRRREQQPDQQQSSTRASGPGVARQSQNFYEPLPLGSDAFMAPLAPRREPRSIEWRQIVLWCVLGTATGGAAGALMLTTLVLDQPAPVSGAVGHVERSTTAAAPTAREARLEADGEPPSAVAAAPTGSDTPEPTAEPGHAVAAQVQPAVEEPSGTTAETTAPAVETTPREQSSSSRRPERRSEKLAEKPSRAQVLAAMARVQPAVRACFEGAHGTVTADMTILGRTGRVTTAQISGQIGRVGSCVARVVRRAKFPKFSTESISIRYPMAF